MQYFSDNLIRGSAYMLSLYLYICVLISLCSGCIPPPNRHSMFHRELHGGMYKYSINTCHPCRRDHRPNSPVQKCQFRHALTKISQTVELLNETARQFEERTAPTDETICREHHGYDIPPEADLVDALIDSYHLLTAVTLNITTIGRIPRNELDTANLQIRFHHLLCDMKFLLYGEDLTHDVYNQELYLPTELTLGDRIILTCRNLHQAINALQFIHTYIGGFFLIE